MTWPSNSILICLITPIKVRIIDDFLDLSLRVTFCRLFTTYTSGDARDAEVSQNISFAEPPALNMGITHRAGTDPSGLNVKRRFCSTVYNVIIRSDAAEMDLS